MAKYASISSRTADSARNLSRVRKSRGAIVGQFYCAVDGDSRMLLSVTNAKKDPQGRMARAGAIEPDDREEVGLRGTIRTDRGLCVMGVDGKMYFWSITTMPVTGQRANSKQLRLGLRELGKTWEEFKWVKGRFDLGEGKEEDFEKWFADSVGSDHEDEVLTESDKSALARELELSDEELEELLSTREEVGRILLGLGADPLDGGADLEGSIGTIKSRLDDHWKLGRGAAEAPSLSNDAIYRILGGKKRSLGKIEGRLAHIKMDSDNRAEWLAIDDAIEAGVRVIEEERIVREHLIAQGFDPDASPIHDDVAKHQGKKEHALYYHSGHMVAAVPIQELNQRVDELEVKSLGVAGAADRAMLTLGRLGLEIHADTDPVIVAGIQIPAGDDQKRLMIARNLRRIADSEIGLDLLRELGEHTGTFPLSLDTGDKFASAGTMFDKIEVVSEGDVSLESPEGAKLGRRPVDVSLFHELRHALHARTGRHLGALEVGMSGWTNEEEWQTIAAENEYRKQSGYQLTRTSHGLDTTYIDQDPVGGFEGFEVPVVRDQTVAEAKVLITRSRLQYSVMAAADHLGEPQDDWIVFCTQPPPGRQFFVGPVDLVAAPASVLARVDLIPVPEFLGRTADAVTEWIGRHDVTVSWRPRRRDPGWTIRRTDPSAGAVKSWDALEDSGLAVWLEGTIRAPDLSEMGWSDARDLVEDLGLAWGCHGIDPALDDSEDWVIDTQSIAPGDEIALHHLLLVKLKPRPRRRVRRGVERDDVDPEDVDNLYGGG